MVSSDTLIRLDTLTRSLSAGSYRQNIDMEVKIQYEYTSITRGKIKEPLGVYRLLRDLQQSRRQEPEDSIMV
jgi:hypothetical protein